VTNHCAGEIVRRQRWNRWMEDWNSEYDTANLTYATLKSNVAICDHAVRVGDETRPVKHEGPALRMEWTSTSLRRHLAFVS